MKPDLRVFSFLKSKIKSSQDRVDLGLLFVVVVVFVVIGIDIPNRGTILGTSTANVARSSDTEFNQGTLSGATVAGSGAGGSVQLEGSAGPAATAYYRNIDIDNT